MLGWGVGDSTHRCEVGHRKVKHTITEPPLPQPHAILPIFLFPGPGAYELAQADRDPLPVRTAHTLL